MISAPCPICTASAHPDYAAFNYLDLHNAPKEYLILRCPNCGLRWLSPQAEADDFQNIYDNTYYDSQYSISFDKKRTELTPYYQHIIAQLKLLGVRDRLLDVGCGRGEFISMALASGLTCEGIEPSRFAANESEKLGAPIWRGTLIDFPTPKTKYAAAFCCHVLEHVNDVHAFMEKLSITLDPDAPIYIEVPLQFDGILDIISRLRGHHPTYSDYSIHHHYFFTPKALTQLLNMHGFEVLSLTTFISYRRRFRKPSMRKFAIQLLLWTANKVHQRGDVISIWARRKK